MRASLLLVPLLILSLPIPAQASRTKRKKRARALAQMIDARIELALSKGGLVPAPQANNGEIIRRLALDLNGMIPTAQTVRNFLKYKSTKKLEVLIEKLLDSPFFDEHFSEELGEAWLKNTAFRYGRVGAKRWRVDNEKKKHETKKTNGFKPAIKTVCVHWISPGHGR